MEAEILSNKLAMCQVPLHFNNESVSGEFISIPLKSLSVRQVLTCDSLYRGSRSVVMIFSKNT